MAFIAIYGKTLSIIMYNHNKIDDPNEIINNDAGLKILLN